MSIDITRPVGDIIAEDFRKAAVLSRNGIDFCCGGKKSLEKACAEKNIDPHKLLREFELLHDVSAGTINRFNDWDPGFLIDYILMNHHSYLKRELPLIQVHLDKVVSRHSENHPELKTLQRLFNDLRQEIEQHLQKEEQILFPYIKELLQAIEEKRTAGNFHCGRISQPIGVMEAEHESAGETLRQMRAAVNDYQLPPDACNTYRLTFDQLQELEADLHQHIHLENNILFPKAAELEAMPAGPEDSLTA
jgi:regulator of cell morphogenesis and NO signaling